MTASMASPSQALTETDVVFGNLIDLARFWAGCSTAEICDTCRTINRDSARFCKGCTHKLPRFYAEMEPAESMPAREQSKPFRPEWPRALDLTVAYRLLFGSRTLAAALGS